MKKPFLIAMALVAAPFAAQAETINLYGWQNHSWEFVDIDGGRSFDRIQSNAGNIGFSASVDTGMDGIKVNLQCEQFTYYNHFGGGTGWCNRNSKIGLSHPMAGEIMFATWLLPYNEGVAQWVDPFYDAGADSHTSIMGSVGANTIFYNTGDFDQQASASGPGTGFDGAEFNYAGLGYDTGFNRRQENIIQYWSPNWNGFVFRFAWTVGNRDETAAPVGNGEIDPIIRSSSLAYTNGPVWAAVTWQDHEDWSAVSVGEMETSDAESIRIAGRYIMDMGDGMSVQISAMYEDLEYEFNGVSNVDAAMAAFGYGGFADSYDLRDTDGVIEAMEVAMPDSPERPDIDIRNYKSYQQMYWTLGLGGVQNDISPTIHRHLKNNTGVNDVPAEYAYTTDNVTPADHAAGVDLKALLAYPENDNIYTEFGNTTPLTMKADDPDTMEVDESMELTEAAQNLKNYLTGYQEVIMAERDKEVADQNPGLIAGYDQLVANAQAGADTEADAQYAAAMDVYNDETLPAYEEAKAAGTKEARRAEASAGQNVKIEREAWMVSGKIKFGGPLDFRFSYMDADDLEVSCASCSGDWDETAADAWNIGLFYTMPAGTELRLTYSEVDNDDNGTYGQGISGTGLGVAGGEIEMFAVGIVHWFD